MIAGNSNKTKKTKTTEQYCSINKPIEEYFNRMKKNNTYSGLGHIFGDAQLETKFLPFEQGRVKSPGGTVIGTEKQLCHAGLHIETGLNLQEALENLQDAWLRNASTNELEELNEVAEAAGATEDQIAEASWVGRRTLQGMSLGVEYATAN
jgi:hypothetical protein